MQRDPTQAFIITIGASAGGLNAISDLVAQLPEDLNAAIFIVLHLSKTGLGEFLVTRLQKYTAFTCLIAKDGEDIEAGRIYIAPPNTHLLIKDGKTRLGHGPAENRWRPSIDVLFRSAAANYGNRVIGIILTGYLDDGTAGMAAIKRSNGYCLVQDPKQAEYADMPQSVLDCVEVDFCIPLNKIGETIVEIAKTTEPKAVAVDKQVQKEAEISESAVVSLDAVAALGEKTLFVCPDCGCGLWSIEHNQNKRYRCHVGHAYSEKDLLFKQGESLEQTMWVALRIVEERRILLQKISDEENRKGLSRLAESNKQKASELQVHIEKLKELLFATQKG